jgi:hypothetical protein
MKMQIDFYSKDEMAIQMDFAGRYPFPETETSELFIFACVTLRQLHNLAQHLTAKALAGLLVSNKSLMNLIQGNQELPSGKELLFHLDYYATSIISQTKGIQESIKASLARQSELQYNDAIMRTLDKEILSKMPKFVKNRGQGKKYFEVTLPPFQLNMRGFGILGNNVNHHAFHSVVGLFRFLAEKHADDQEFLNHLIEVAMHCGTLYIFKQTSTDQVSLASMILKQVGIS